MTPLIVLISNNNYSFTVSSFFIFLSNFMNNIRIIIKMIHTTEPIAITKIPPHSGKSNINSEDSPNNTNIKIEIAILYFSSFFLSFIY